ncbi:hypothetical protein Asp14428_32990 [Actinoplanes sp. NBRC 14428]|nr:hypothetical protein Asp14428_32990 [Actinoplanes sp. NBRC 14428]
MTTDTEVPPKRLRLMGAHEIRVRLGMTRRDTYRVTSQASFPRPLAILGQGKIWREDDVEQWIRTRRPDLREQNQTP